MSLDLPLTPHHPEGHGKVPVASSDEQVLPFIRRLLMEEEEEDADDDDDILYQRYPDHPAILKAEQPFAQIPAATSSQAYVPDELSQLLLPSSAGLQQSVGEEASAFFNGPGVSAATHSSCDFQFQLQQDGPEETTVLAAGDGAVTMEMLNQAFLKGMEEANKFLPTTNSISLLLHRGHGSQLPRVFLASKQRVRYWDWDGDDDSMEAVRRSAKLMAPEPEESGEVVAGGVFLKAYEVAWHKMNGLSISRSSAPPSGGYEEEKSKSQSQQQRRRRRRRQSSGNEAVDLRTLLIHCAEAVSTGNRVSATELLRQINHRSSPTGDASQRLAHCFAGGLANVREMSPDVFILCVENTSYGAPFFVARFREALFYYSAMFDMMEATAPRDSAGRMVMEQEVLGRSDMNAVACEGSARVERPETYKQWQVRCRRAGLRQLPLNPSSVKFLSDKVKNGYHSDFVIHVDQHWLLQGWKGRILYAMSTWTACG